MRIALVAGRLPPARMGGAELYVARLATALAERHDVLVATSAGGDALGTTRARVAGLRDLAADAPLPGKLVWHALDQWLPPTHLQLVRALRTFRPDVVHTHEVQGMSAAPFTAVAQLGLPHVHTAHDLNLLCARTTMTRGGRFCGGRCRACLVQRSIRARLARLRLDHLIAPSQSLRDAHVRAGVVTPDRVTTIPNGAPEAATRTRKARNPLNVGFVGRLAQHKGLHTLLGAFEGAPPHWRLVVAGAGPLAGRVEELARRDGRLRYAGYVDGAEKDAVFDELDVLVIPSECEENAPLVAVEAAVRGLPAVVSDRGGLPETPAATVFRSGDPRALVDAVGSLEPHLQAVSEELVSRRREFLWSTHLARVEATLEATASRASAVPRES